MSQITFKIIHIREHSFSLNSSLRATLKEEHGSQEVQLAKPSFATNFSAFKVHVKIR